MDTQKRLPLNMVPQAQLRKAWAEGRTFYTYRTRPRAEDKPVDEMTLADLIATQRTGALQSESRRCWNATGHGAASLDQSNGEDENGEAVTFADMVTDANCAPHKWTPFESIDPKTADLIEFERYASQCGATVKARPVASATGSIAVQFDRYSRPEARIRVAQRMREFLIREFGADAIAGTYEQLRERIDLVRDAIESDPTASEHRFDIERQAERDARRMDERPRLSNSTMCMRGDPLCTPSQPCPRHGYPGPTSDEFAPHYARA